MHITLADLTAGVDKTYDIRRMANHSHMITRTAADFATLKSASTTARVMSVSIAVDDEPSLSGGTVHKYATSKTQPHCITISCGVAGAPVQGMECAADVFVCKCAELPRFLRCANLG